MSFARVNGAVLHYLHREGTGRGVVFLNSLGTDHRIWESAAGRLPKDIPLLFLDKRGHGLSETAPATMETFAEDVAALMDRCAMADALVCGVSIGGLIAQTLALRRPDLVGGLVLSNTGLRIGDPESWTARLDALETSGLEGMADGVLSRWFSDGFRTSNPDEVEGYRAMLTRTPKAGYAAACEAIRDTDLSGRAAEIAVPTLCIAGGADIATPPALVRALADAIPGATYEELDGVGHLPSIESPERVADLVQRTYGRLA
ncbi:3-oxoadipate enol-lactonase [Tropicimonas sp. IMCC34011]|uniref:3-oxoadipate enol-lactonase n=1 Tax=Tropicimonas sp. IMCC34011 TaxID=2248759 RepID=UPI000E2639B8|nr:3-oxoadipate enol-lactonase [Tropicimonas sp. IMCC34011]